MVELLAGKIRCFEPTFNLEDFLDDCTNQGEFGYMHCFHFDLTANVSANKIQLQDAVQRLSEEKANVIEELIGQSHLVYGLLR